MKTLKPISGFDLVQKVFNAYPENPIGKLLEFTNGETEFLELKATCVFDPNDTEHNKPGENQNDLSWNIARELFALYNSKGGMLIIGIDDKTFKRVLLPSFAGSNENDYIRNMVLAKIFPGQCECEWKTRNGADVYSCSQEELTRFKRNFLQQELVDYQGGKVIALLVKPAPCQSGGCINITFRKNQGDPYNQLPVRETGKTGGVHIFTKDADKQQHERTRHCVDVEFSRLWQKWQPQTTKGKNKTDSPKGTGNRTEAVPEEGSDPSSDPLIRALEGRQLETDFAIGTFIDGYKVVRRIGQGGMGVVYEVEHPTLGTRRALKVFAPDDENDLLKRKFLTEARLLARFNHPGLVRVHTLAIAKTSATLYYEMDFIHSATNYPQSLKDIYNKIKDDPPSNKELMRWFSQLCFVLEYLHKEQKIVHRDIKLENILLDGRGFVILSDFGIARIQNQELKASVGDGVTINPTINGVGDALVGTKEYLAPELGTEKATAKSDIYALGVVFFKLLTGRDYREESGPELKDCLKGKPYFWRRTLPKLLARIPKNRIGDLKKYAVTVKYPYVGVLRWLLRILVAYALLHLIVSGIHVWHAPDKSASLNEVWPVQESVATLTTAEPTALPNGDNDAALSHGNASCVQSAKHTSPMPHPPPVASPAAKPDNDVSPYSQAEIDIAENDIRRLSYRRISPTGTRRTKSGLADEGQEDWLTAEIDAIHEKTFKIWRAMDELTSLGMRIEEILKSREDLVHGCIDIRREACAKINSLIAGADYKRALKLYKATNSEFSNNGFSEIPRPSFTPDNSTGK